MCDCMLKIATFEDEKVLFEWANDKDVRSNAFSTSQIKFSEHDKWFRDRIYSEKTVIYILYVKKIPVGQIRIDINDEMCSAEIDYSIDKNYRCKGYGRKILKLLEDDVKEKMSSIEILYANVKKDNISSINRFKELNYIMTSDDNDVIHFEKRMR